MDRFLGVGLTNALAVALFTVLVILALKVIFVKYELPGVEVVTAI